MAITRKLTSVSIKFDRIKIKSLNPAVCRLIKEAVYTNVLYVGSNSDNPQLSAKPFKDCITAKFHEADFFHGIGLEEVKATFIPYAAGAWSP
jgi:hypothetical protein